MPTVSVIMPVYNARKYVRDAIESVLNQTFSDFELILVDDGAKDGSGEICDEYSVRDRRITVIHKENGGICSARNCALKVAKGKYVAFCDHDDLYSEVYLETAVKTAEEQSSELVKFTYRGEIWNNGVKTAVTERKLPQDTLEIEQLINQYDLFNLVLRGIWNGIYLRTVLVENHIWFDETFKVGMEDYYFNLEVLNKIHKVTMIPDSLFIHFSRLEQSSFEKYDERRYADILRTAQQEKVFLNQFSQFKKGNWARHQSQYLTLYLRTLVNPGNAMSAREKCLRLQSVNCKTGLKLNCAKWECIRLLPRWPKEFIITVLYNFHLYRLLIMIYTGHRKRQL